MTKALNIDKEACYASKRNIFSISLYRECLEKFSKNFEKEAALETESPIFLDTNILLRYYSISFNAREKLFQFIKKNKARIIITPQVQYEFIKNREDVIQRFFEQVTTKIPKDFNTDVVNKMKAFLDNHKIVLKDYPFVETGINKHQSELEDILKQLNETVEQRQKELLNLIVSDNFLDLLSTCNLCDGLSDEETNTVKKDFDVLAKNISAETSDSLLNKSNFVFPGFGDIKLKPEDPYGDFIIFHEIMKYMLNKKLTVTFLTFDNSKGDWMTKSKSPHLHYTLNMYANTGHILYIIDAERSLGELLNVNIDSLVEETNEIQDSITLESFNEHLTSNYTTHDYNFSQIEEKINNIMFDKKVFLNHDYTIRRLSDDTGIQAYILSAFINRRYGMNFNDFINEFKIKHCIEKIKNEEWRYKTLEALSRESGFNNRNSFILAFKKVMGVTPADFLKQIVIN